MGKRVKDVIGSLKKFNLLQWHKKGHAVNHTGRCCFLNKISCIRSQTIGKKLRNGKWYGGEGIGDGMGMKFGWRKLFFFFFSLNSM